MIDRFPTPLATEYIDGNKTNPNYGAYDASGPYLNFHILRVASWAIVTLGENGIPRNSQGGGEHYNPVTIAHYGLEMASQHLRDLGDRRTEVARIVRYALQAQNRDGGWPFTFDHTFFAGRVRPMPAGWYSALSQGMMISVYARWHSRISGGSNTFPEAALRDSIERSCDIIALDVERGGVRRRIFDGMDFYEEYPTHPPSLVLNGFMFCLLGLYDGAQVFGSQSCGELYERGVATLAKVLAMYDLADGSSYDLTHITTGIEGPNQARSAYHRLHISLLAALSSVNEGRFDRIVSRWDSYLKGNRLRTN